MFAISQYVIVPNYSQFSTQNKKPCKQLLKIFQYNEVITTGEFISI